MVDAAFALVLNLHQPAYNLENLLHTREWEASEILWAMDRIPRSLWACDDAGRVHLSLSGTLLETLASPGFQHRAYGDNVSTDEIMPAGAEGMSLWSNLPGMAQHAFRPVDGSYVQRARDTGDHAIMAGRNYGQGSSREQAALAPRSLGLRLVIARSIARIHAENLVNFGILPLTLGDEGDEGKSCSPARPSASADYTRHCATASASWTCRPTAPRSAASTRCPHGRPRSCSPAAAFPGTPAARPGRELDDGPRETSPACGPGSRDMPNPGLRSSQAGQKFRP